MTRIVAVALLVAALAAPGAAARPLPGAPKCPMFPGWPTSKRVDALPVAPGSGAMVASIGVSDHVHPDFGAGLWEGRRIGIPFDVVSRRTARSRVTFDYAEESDRVRYPIPRGVHIEGGADRHALLVDRDACRLYELFALERRPAGWHAGSGATWRLTRTPRYRPAGWTSADAAGLPILPLLARYDEVARGRIDHALRMTVRRSRRAWVLPARHFASSLTDASLPRMGERLRLKASVDISGFPRQARVIARAMKEYGLIVADNGSDWYVSGAPDPRWDDDQLRALKALSGADFEVVSR